MSYSLKLTNASPVTLYAFEVTPAGSEVTLTDQLVVVPPNQTVEIASFDPPHTDSWGWVSVGLAKDDRAYQLYCERTYDGYHSYAFFGFYDATNTEQRPNNSPLPEGVATASPGQANYNYAFLGKTVDYRLKLVSLAGGTTAWQLHDDAAQAWRPLLGQLSRDGRPWTFVCGLEIDGVTTEVVLHIENALDPAQPFDVEVTQDGVWKNGFHIPSGRTISQSLALQVPKDGSSVVEINKASAVLVEVPDPRLTITRKGG